MRIATRILVLSLTLGLLSAVAYCVRRSVGFVSYDDLGTGGLFQFNATSQTGPNSSPPGDPTWPVTNTISFSNLTLTVDFVSGPPIVLRPRILEHRSRWLVVLWPPTAGWRSGHDRLP